MQFSELLEQMAICGSQISLLQMVDQFAFFAEQFKGLNFADFLKILAYYCQVEGENDLVVNVNATWDVVGELLACAADNLKPLYSQEVGGSTPWDLQMVKAISDCFRKMILFQMICLWTKALEEDKCRFADILAALAEYADNEALENPSTSHIWKIAAAMIRAAQQKAETGAEGGQELP